MPNIFETTDAPGNTSTPYALAVGQTAQGTLSTGADHDFYRISLVAGQTYTVAMVGTGVNNVTNTFLNVYGADGTTLIASNNDGLQNLNSLVTFTASTTGTYYIDAGSSGNFYAGQYGVSVTAGTKASFDAQMGAGVIDTNRSWSATPGTAATVTWAFRQTVDSTVARDAQGNPVTTGSQLSAAEQTAVQAALAMYSGYANLTFQQQNPGGFSDNATVLFANYNSTTDGAGAYAYYPGSAAAGSVAGDVWLNTNSVSTTSLPPGQYSYFALIHEMGHAMGLSHPGLYNAAPGVSITYNNNAQFVQDSHQYSVMSYFDESNTTSSYGSYPDTLMMLDIYALQNIYGINYSTRGTNSVYGYNSNVGGVYDFTTNTDPALCIWDGGGIDTLDGSGWGGGQTINLADGAFSSMRGLSNNVSIAIGAVIENAVGGAGSDTLLGNNANNVLTGNGGVNNLTGGGGWDRANYGIASSAATITRNSNGTVTIAGSGFSDTLTGVEVAHFTDKDVAIREVARGDFNGEGTSDLVLQSGGTVVDWIMQNGAYQAGNVLTTGATGFTVVGKGDFNGDGTADLALQSGGTVVNWIMSNGAYQSGNVITTGASGFTVVGCGDLNGDGTTDLVLQSGGTVVDWIMKNGQFQSGNIITTGATGFTVV